MVVGTADIGYRDHAGISMCSVLPNERVSWDIDHISSVEGVDPRLIIEDVTARIADFYHVLDMN